MSERLERGSRIVVASHNPGKAWEIHQLIAPYGLAAISAADLGLAEPEETEPTFHGNARLKAVAAAKTSGLPALADDSGLEIEALDGAPGIYSARWAGKGKDFGLAMRRVHEALVAKGAWNGPPPRANFISVLCLAWPTGAHAFYEGRVFGTLVWPPRGGNGFGYDPMFVAEGETRTFGEMEPKEKYAISHRTRAFAAFRAACLDGGPGDDYGPGPDAIRGRDLAALSAAAANLSTRAELVRFVANLRHDLEMNGDGWENADLPRYLEAMEVFLASGDLPEEPRWRTLARVLLAASLYE